jgi:hypothetical protein
MSKVQHVYAVFESPKAAMAAFQEVQAKGCSTEHCSAILHERHLDESLLRTGERAGTEGAADGAAVAGALGAIVGGIAALGGGLVGIGPLAAAALGGGVMAAYGALSGRIAASDEPERHLRALAGEVEAGKVLIAVETDDPKLEALCEQVFLEHGGRQVVF